MDFNGIGTSYSAYETKNVSAKSTNDKKLIQLINLQKNLFILK